jgi:hypothetical protein
MYWRAVFVSRVAEKAATDLVKAKTEAANAMMAEEDDAEAKTRLATAAAVFLQEAQEEWARCQVTLDGLDYVCPWTAPSESASLSKEERNRVLFECPDEEIEMDKRDSNASMYLRLKVMIREMSALQY